jgi:hypothetical protein
MIGRMERQYGTPWCKPLWDAIAAFNPPNLAGSGLVIGWDGREEHGYAVDCFLCTNQSSLDRWEPLRQKVRSTFLSDARGIEYKKLDSDAQRRRALQPALNAASEMDGACVVVLSDKRLDGERRKHVAQGLRQMQTMKDGEEDVLKYKGWETDEFIRAMRMVNILSMLIAGMSQPNQSVRWLCDEDNVWGNTQQKRDMERLLSRLCMAHVPHPLGPCSYGTYMTGGTLSLAAKDFSCLADLVAGGVSDSLALLEGQTGPVVMSRQSPTEIGKAEAIARWFWGPDSKPLKRIAIRVRKYDQSRTIVEGMNVEVRQGGATTCDVSGI